MSEETLLFIGTGASMGVPVVGCKCAVCQSSSPFNKRFRTSALLTINEKVILIDAGPDFRMQALKYGIDHLDGVILTHAHQDHTGGLDELRAYHMHNGGILPCLLSHATAEEIQERYNYIFLKGNPSGKLISKIHLMLLEGGRGKVNFLGEDINYFSYEQGGMAVNGFRIGNLAYVSDIRDYSESIFEDLKGVEKLILSALRQEKSKLHFGIDEAIEFSKKVKASETWLTHISHDVDHLLINQNLPFNVFMAYDGLSIKFQV